MESSMFASFLYGSNIGYMSTLLGVGDKAQSQYFPVTAGNCQQSWKYLKLIWIRLLELGDRFLEMAVVYAQDRIYYHRHSP
ncbi:hypothetical protein [Calothrix sp. NIES-3974]|uniref:hypothetical protein n=1 Tax=Calothrix sp. NIES-3974 TaxID=2005462 RepID=UPI0012FE70AE|nr:hypothetical protein [Calothrix sp. NIES-3974]